MINFDDMQRQLLEAFADESVELLERMARCLVSAERAGGGDVADPLLQLRRCLHTLKGSAGAVGFGDVALVGHEFENFIARVGDRAPSTGELDLMHRTVHYLELACRGGAVDSPSEIVALLETWDVTGAGEGPMAPPSPVVAQLVAAAAAAPAPTSPEVAPLDPPAAETPPAAAAPEREGARRPASRGTDTLRVSAGKIDQLQSSVGDLVVSHLAQSENAIQLHHIRDSSLELADSWRRVHSAIRGLREGVPARAWSKLEAQMHAFSGQLNSLHRDSVGLARLQQREVGQLGMVAESLDVGLRALRMMPLAPWYDGFQAAVRDAARQVGREVRVVVEATDIEVDRVVLDRLRDPVLHILRNAIAHGIEAPEDRLAAGKPAVGEIQLSTESTGEKVRIRISDDGRGVDRVAVRQRASAARLLQDGLELDDTRLLEILAHAGFSTANQVSNVAGRGVGLNVVLDAVQELGGSVSLRSPATGGTTFDLVVPATVTSAKGVVVLVGPYRIGIPMQGIDRLVRVGSADVERLDRSDVVRIDGVPVAIASLAVLLGEPQHAARMDMGAVKTVVLRSGHSRLAVTVDDVVNDLPMMVKPLTGQFERLRHFGGCAAEADGSLLLVLEVRELIRVAQRSGRGRLEAALSRSQVGERADTGRQKAILVVDDSITTRTLERNILEAAGYRVVSACDGQEGLDVLTTGGGFDLVVTDIDMPRMDGFELCQRIRHGSFSHMPVIMVTSRNTAEEKARGVQSGADAFIVKRDFDQARFLGIVERLLD